MKNLKNFTKLHILPNNYKKPKVNCNKNENT